MVGAGKSCIGEIQKSGKRKSLVLKRYRKVSTISLQIAESLNVHIYVALYLDIVNII